MTHSLTEGKPYKSIVRFSIPLLLGNLFQQFYNMADAIIVSKTLGVNPFAGVSSAGSIIFLILGFAQGLTAGLAVLVSQKYGADDRDGVKVCYAHNFWICTIVAAVLSAGSLTATAGILNVMQTPADIWVYAYEYLQVIFIGITASMMFNFFSNTIYALGDSRTPFFYLIIASLLNIALDFILIQYFSMGVAGAAWATVLSQAISALLCAGTIHRKYRNILYGQMRRVTGKGMLHNLKTGLPMAFQSSIIALGVNIIQIATNQMGTVAVAAYATAAKIDGIAVEPLKAIGMAMTTYTAQNYGAGKSRRIIAGVRQCALISVIMAVVLGGLLIAIGRPVAAIFVGPQEQEIIALAHQYLIVHGALYIILAFLFVYRFALQGLGKTVVPTVAGAMELLMRTLSAVWIVPVLGYTGLCISTPLSWLAAAIPVLIAWLIAAKKLKGRPIGRPGHTQRPVKVNRETVEAKECVL